MVSGSRGYPIVVVELGSLVVSHDFYRYCVVCTKSCLHWHCTSESCKAILPYILRIPPFPQQSTQSLWWAQLFPTTSPDIKALRCPFTGTAYRGPNTIGNSAVVCTTISLCPLSTTSSVSRATSLMLYASETPSSLSSSGFRLESMSLEPVILPSQQKQFF